MASAAEALATTRLTRRNLQDTRVTRAAMPSNKTLSANMITYPACACSARVLPVEDIAGGGDEVWEQAISKLKKRFTFGHRDVEKVKFYSREVVQAADGSMRVGRPAYIKSLDFVPRETEEGTIGRCQRERKSCHEIGAWSFRVPST